MITWPRLPNALIAFDRAPVLRRQELLSIRQSLARRTK
jgi:hypothetical protein